MSLLNLKCTLPGTKPERDLGCCFLVCLFSIILIPPPCDKNCTVNWKMVEFLKSDKTFGNLFYLLLLSWFCSGRQEAPFWQAREAAQGGQVWLLWPAFPLLCPCAALRGQNPVWI